MRIEIAHRHPFHPVGQRMRAQTLSGLHIRLFRDAINSGGLAHLLNHIAKPSHRVIDRGFDTVRIKDGRGEHIFEQLTGLRRVEHVAGLVDAELVEDY